MIQRGLKAWIRTAALGFLTSESTKRSIRFRPRRSPYHRGSLMRKFLAIKINCTLNMYFPRLPPKLLKLGQVPCRGNESGGNFDIRFCHFFDVVGSNPVWCMKRKSAFFSFFLFFFARKSQITKPHYTKFVSGYVRAQVSLFSLFTLVIARLYPPPKGVFRSFFRPSATKTTSQLKFSHSGGANKSCSTLFHVDWPRMTKRFDSFRSFLRFLTLKML